MNIKKILSVLLALSMLCSFACCFAAAADANAVIGKAYISVADTVARPTPAETDDPYKYPEPVGTIYARSEVELHQGDTILDVTKRFVEDVKGAKAVSKITPYSTYISAFENVTTASGKKLDSIGEFDAGAESGWMVRLNNQFLSVGADQAAVEADDEIAWMYTCKYGADIGNDWNVTSAEITGLTFSAGSLTPAFSADVNEYTLTLPAGTKTVKAEAALKNYSSKVTYTLTHDGKDTEYKFNRDIPASDGDKLTVKSEYFDWSGNVTDTDTVTVSITVEAKKDSRASLIRSFIFAIIEFFKNIFSFFKK